MARIRAGDPRAEEELVARYGRGVALVLRRHTNGRPEAEDLYQDAFRLALEKLRGGELRQPEKLPGFLSRLARNLAIEHYRKARRRRTEADSEAVAAATVPSPQLRPLLAGEQAFLVRRLLGELRNERDRQVLFRVYLAEEDKETICDEFGLTGPQFNRVLHRARQRYKELYLRRAGGATAVLLAWLVLWSATFPLGSLRG